LDRKFWKIADMNITLFIDEQIIGLLKQAEAGMSIKELCRSCGMVASDATRAARFGV
jgi:hypothetical protein